MPAEYVMKVQVINSKRRQPRFFVNIPLPLAAALDLAAASKSNGNSWAARTSAYSDWPRPRPHQSLKSSRRVFQQNQC